MNLIETRIPMLAPNLKDERERKDRIPVEIRAAIVEALPDPLQAI